MQQEAVCSDRRHSAIGVNSYWGAEPSYFVGITP